MPLKSKAQAFKEFKAGDLHSGKGGKVVTSRKQAIAIALSVDRESDEERKRRKRAEDMMGKGAKAAPKH